MKKLNEKQEIDLLFIKDWCLTIIDFVYSKYETNSYLIKMHKDVFSEETKQRYLRDASAAIYLRGLKQVYNDTNEMARGLPPQIQEELNNLLLTKFKKDLNTYSQANLKQIKKIIKRDKITSEDEYRLIDEAVNELCQTNPKSPEIDLLNNLLLEYHQAKNKSS